jgi:hypothetical protein
MSLRPFIQVRFWWLISVSYCGRRDQEAHHSKPVWANSSPDSILKKPNTKRGLVESAQDVGPEFKPQYHRKKKDSLFRSSCDIRKCGHHVHHFISIN